MAKRRRPAREFVLGAPGETLRVSYPIETKSERFWGYVTPALLGLCGVVLVSGQSKAFGAVLLGVAIVLLLMSRGSKTGVVVVDSAHLEIGPERGTRRVALEQVIDTSRAVGSSTTEQFMVRFKDTSKQGFGLAVALLPRAVADELDARIMLRARVARLDEPRAIEAAEALYRAGGEVIGVYLVAGAWRPFSSTAELASVMSRHAFRDRERVVVCVSPPVWEALRDTELANPIEAIVVPD